MTRRLDRLLPALGALVLISAPDLFSRVVNVAPSGTATQSTTGFGGNPERAIDGNTSGAWGNGSVSHTAGGDPAPTWEVDLGEDYEIDSVVLWNRTDCCSARLTNFVVSVLDVDRGEVFSEGFFTDGTEFPDTTENGFEIPVGATGRIVQVRVLDTHEGFDPAQYFVSLAEVQVFTQFEGVLPDDVNIGPIGTATQTSTSNGGEAARAIDGNTSGAWGDGSVTHTASDDPAPSWEVDLGLTVMPTGIVLWNRTDCCTNRLTNFKVQILDADRGEVFSETLFEDGTAFPDTSAAGLEIPVPDGTMGQIVRVERLGPDSDGNLLLSLAEVQVFVDPTTLPVLIIEQPQGGRVYEGACGFEFSVTLADPSGATFQWQLDGTDIPGATASFLMLTDIQASDAGSYTVVASKDGFDVVSEPAVLDVPGRNLALAGVATQTSIASGGEPGRGIDGNVDGTYNNGSVTHTADEPDGYWEVELFGDSTIHTIVVWNRTDCCRERLTNIAVQVLAADRTEVYSTDLFTDGSVPETRSIEVAVPEGTMGRVVRVQRLGISAGNNNIISLAEVEVFGDGPLPPASPNLTQRCGVTTRQSSQLGSFSPNLAIDRNLGNFTHTLGTDVNATWEVDLGGLTGIGAVVLHNRTSCCGSRLRDITVSILDGADEDGGAVLFESELLNPENELGTFPNGPSKLTVNVVEMIGDVVAGRIVRVRRAPDADLSGTGGQGNADEANVLSLGEVEIFAELATVPQISGDCNQDGGVDTADVVCLVNLLFTGFNLLDREAPPLPCATPEGDIEILDASDNGVIDVADIVSLAGFLFSGGPPPAGGVACRGIDEALGCPAGAGCQ